MQWWKKWQNRPTGKKMRKTVFGIRPSAQCFILFGFGIGQEFSFRCIPNTNIYECWWSCCFFLDFILAETHRKIFVLLFVDNSMQIFKWFSLQIWEDVCRTYHIVTCLKKIYKNVTEQMTSNSVLAQIFLALWTLNPGATSSCSAVWIHAVRACIRKHNILQFIYQSFEAILRFQSSQ